MIHYTMGKGVSWIVGTFFTFVSSSAEGISYCIIGYLYFLF